MAFDIRENQRTSTGMLIVNGEIVNERNYINISMSDVASCVATGSVITTMDLSANNLRTFDASELPELEFIKASFNQLESFVLDGETVKPNLASVDLSVNQLDAFVCKSNSSLRFLNLSENKLTSFSEDNGGPYPKLIVLDLSNNLLTSFVMGDYIGRLVVIDLAYNKLTSFSVKGTIPFLKDLFLNNNPLRTLILTREQVPNLNRLDLGDTDVLFVDKSLMNSVEGKEIEARGHFLGIEAYINDAFHDGCPLIEEICEEIQV